MIGDIFRTLSRSLSAQQDGGGGAQLLRRHEATYMSMEWSTAPEVKALLVDAAAAAAAAAAATGESDLVVYT